MSHFDFMFKKPLLLASLLVFFLGAGFGCQTKIDEATLKASQPIKLVFWQAFDDSDAFSEAINKYQVLHPNITIEYKKFRYEEYENQLLNAWAEDRGPDIFAVHNTWIKKYQSKITPLPEYTSVAYFVESSGLKKELVPELRATRSLSTRELKNNFADVVASDAILEDGLIYGLPLSIDTLALYYNRDLLNSAGIVEPPRYWNREFQQAVKKMTKQDPKKGLIQSGIALGTTNNINRASDILMVLMMQNGATIIDENSRVIFNQVPAYITSGYNPGLEALRFYTDFSNPNKEVYCWNDEQENALDAFTSGNLAMMLGYSFNLEQIRSQAPKLNFGIAKLPQIEGNQLQMNMANYWLLTVSKKSDYSDAAWDFIQFLTKKENADVYLQKTAKPTALKASINDQKNDEYLGPFAEQVLSAKSWYQGLSAQDAEGAIGEMINNALNPNFKIMDVLNDGAIKVQQTIR